MVVNVAKLKEAGITVRAFKLDDLKFELPQGFKLEIFFEQGKFPQELHDAIRALMPGLRIEADIVAEGTFRKIHDLLIVQACQETGE